MQIDERLTDFTGNEDEKPATSNGLRSKESSLIDSQTHYKSNWVTITFVITLRTHVRNYITNTRAHYNHSNDEHSTCIVTAMTHSDHIKCIKSGTFHDDILGHLEQHAFDLPVTKSAWAGYETRVHNNGQYSGPLYHHFDLAPIRETQNREVNQPIYRWSSQCTCGADDEDDTYFTWSWKRFDFSRFNTPVFNIQLWKLTTGQPASQLRPTEPKSRHVVVVSCGSSTLTVIY